MLLISLCLPFMLIGGVLTYKKLYSMFFQIKVTFLNLLLFKNYTTDQKPVVRSMTQFSLF